MVEGVAIPIAKGDPLYPGLLEALRSKNPLAARFTEEGILFCLAPRRLVLRKGVHPERNVIEFEQADE